MLHTNQVMINIWSVAYNTTATIIVSLHTVSTRTHTSHHAPPVGVFYWLVVIQSTAPNQHPTHQLPHAQATTPTGQQGQGSKNFITY